MALIDKTIIVKWNKSTYEHYQSKGYIFTDWGYEFEIRTEDLTGGSGKHIQVACDECGEILNPSWYDYRNHIHDDGKYYCHKCSNRLFGTRKMAKVRLESSLSFKEWCVKNLSKEKSDEILSRWDYELNVDINGNKITPSDVTYSSMGATKCGYWFKCFDNTEHKSEMHSINNFTKGNKVIICNQCNSIAAKHPDLIKYCVNEEDAYKYAALSSVKILMKCPDCGFIRPMRISQLVNYKFSCPKCGDGVSYPEKIMFNALEQLGIEFQTQLTKTTFKWCNGYRYDFYIPSINCIIETHGGQHYEEHIKNAKFMHSLQEEQENDELKKQLAKDNGVKYYIIIDCRFSELSYIKDNILSSKLSILYNISNINWSKCQEDSQSSLSKNICCLRDIGITNTLEISNILNISKSSVWRYLKQAT